jgi:hypothetical protein
MRIISRVSTLVASVIISAGALGCTRTANEGKGYLAVVEQHGWSDDFRRGEDLLRLLSTLSTEKKTTFDISAFRGLHVAFYGAGAPPGATHDILTPDGFYLRILNKESQDLRPTSVWWTVLCRGEVLQVLPEHKLIVIEVSTKDWIVLDTG